MPGSGRSGGTSQRTVWVYLAQGACRTRPGGGRRHAVSAASPAGEPGATGQRMARGRKAQQAFLQDLARRQVGAEAAARRMAGHWTVARRNFEGVRSWNFLIVT